MATEQRVHHPSEETLLRCAVALEELIYGDDSSLDIARSIVDKSIKSYSDDQLTRVGQGAFGSCSSLASVELPACTSLDNGAFAGCSSLTSLSLPKCKTLGPWAFSTCLKLTSIDLGSIQSFQTQAFYSDYSLTTVIIRTTSKVATLSWTNVFDLCYHFYGTVDATYNPDGLKDGYIYVPDTLVDSYKTATNWVTLADQIKPLSELPTK